MVKRVHLKGQQTPFSQGTYIVYQRSLRKSRSGFVIPKVWKCQYEHTMYTDMIKWKSFNHLNSFYATKNKFTTFDSNLWKKRGTLNKTKPNNHDFSFVFDSSKIIRIWRILNNKMLFGVLKLLLHKFWGNMKIYYPRKKSNFPRAKPFGNIICENKSSYFSNHHAINV